MVCWRGSIFAFGSWFLSLTFLFDLLSTMTAQFNDYYCCNDARSLVKVKKESPFHPKDVAASLETKS